MNKNNRNAFILTALCIVCGAAITAAHIWLGPAIAEQQTKATATIYLDTLLLKPSVDIHLDSTRTTNDSALLGLREPKRIYVARQHDRTLGAVLPVTAREGYAGDIDLLIGIDSDGKLISVRVLAHRETRDLGDKIESGKSAWLEQFRGATFTDGNQDQWRWRGEGGAFDAITGATVTSNAVTKAIQQALVYFDMHRDELVGNSDAN